MILALLTGCLFQTHLKATPPPLSKAAVLGSEDLD